MPKISELAAATAITGSDTLAIVQAGDTKQLPVTAITGYARTAAEIAASVTPTAYQYPPGDVRRYGAVAETPLSVPSSDSSAAFRAAVAAGHPITVPDGAFKITPLSGVGLSITNTRVFSGSGRNSEIWFAAAADTDVLFDLQLNNTWSTFRGFRLRAVTAGRGVAVRITDNIGAGGNANWKNAFENVRWDDFFVGVSHTSANPLSGTTHAHGDSTYFGNCRFRNCRTTFLHQNIQSVNLGLYQTDIENDDTGEQYVFFRDEAGISCQIYGGSMIGRGKFYQAVYDAAGTTLFPGARFVVDAARFETRSGHNGVFCEQVAGFKAGSCALHIVFRNCTFILSNQTLDFLRYAGRLILNVIDCQSLSGDWIIRQYPTSGYSSNLTTGAQSRVNIVRSENFFLEKETTSPYGTYSARTTGQVFIEPGPATVNDSMSQDADGFWSLKDYTAVSQFAYGLQAVQGNNRLIWNDDLTTAGFASISAILPKHNRPLKFFMYKHPQRYADAIAYKLYLVKDKAAWAGGTFSVSTDALEVASISATTNTAGYYQANVVLTANSLGNILTSGEGSWTEGRIYIEKTGGNNMAGFVGVEFT